MFVLKDIERLEDDLKNVPANCEHVMTYRVVYTLHDVLDDFNGMVYRTADGELKMEHFNPPRGNRRKTFTLKNKLPPGSFDKIASFIYAVARGETVDYPQEVEAKKLSSRTMGG